jgi:hypothetical protein
MFQNSITIVEDSSDESKNATRVHIQNIVNEYFRDPQKFKISKTQNPWFEEFWRAASNCPKLQNCGKRDLADFKIDSKVI